MIPVELTPADLLRLLGLGQYASTVLALVFFAGGIASFFAAWLPPATDQSPIWWRIVRGIIDAFASNYRNAKNR